MTEKRKFLKPSPYFNQNNNTLVFQPTTLEGVEQFSIYSVDESKFYNAGDELTIDGETKTVEDWKFTKMTDDQKAKFQRRVKYLRAVKINGEEMIYPAPSSVEKELLKTMDTIKAMGGDPLSMTYIVTKKPGAAPMEMYSVSIGPKADSNKPAPEFDLDLEDDGALELTAQEHQYVDIIQKKYPDYASRSVDSMSKVFVAKLNISPARATRIVQEYLQ